MTNGKNLLLKTIVLFSIITSIIFCGVGNIHVTSTTVYAATRGQKEALEDAKSYLKYSSFSLITICLLLSITSGLFCDHSKVNKDIASIIIINLFILSPVSF